MKLFSRTPSPLSLDPPSPPQTPQQPPSSPPRRPRLRHGAPPFYECWAQVRLNRHKPILRFCTLSGAHLRYSAAPGHKVLPASLLIYGAVIEEFHGRIVIRLPDARLTILPEQRDQYSPLLEELRIAARRSLHEQYSFCTDLRGTPFGRISRAVDVDTSQLFTVKVVCKHLLQSRHVAAARKEAVVLLSMPEHPNIISIADVYESARCVYLVTRSHDAQTLSEVLAKKGNLCEADVATIIKALLKALVHLKQSKVVHRLITPQNVLLHPTSKHVGVPILSNFETAVSAVDIDDWKCVLEHFKNGPFDISHAQYLSPEVCAGAVGGYEQDLWSLGILMHYLLVGYTPFEFEDVDSVAELADVIAHAKGMPSFSGPLWKGVTSVAKHLCASLLHADPKLRVTAENALQHPWLNM